MDKEVFDAFTRMTEMLNEVLASVDEIEKSTEEIKIRVQNIEKKLWKPE